MDSDLSGFHKLTLKKRLELVARAAGLDRRETQLLKRRGALDLALADMMSENVIGTIQLPLSVATNFRINGRDVLVPMAIEEPSVVAAASHAAKLTRPDGFSASSDEPLMIGQIQLVGAPDAAAAVNALHAHKERILELANAQDKTIIGLGGGAQDLEARPLSTEHGTMIAVYLTIDVRDAMGANLVNTMCEAVSPLIEELTGAQARLRIISNLATKRLARAQAVWKKEAIGEVTVDKILHAYAFACADRYRCATHNKGIMNGIDAVAIATGNDFRAVEAGAHAYAARNGYQPLTRYWKDERGDLAGSIELPIACGTVGGATRTHPVAKVSLKILDVKTARELAEVMACVGLANNFAALRALATEGIQKGHLKLHAKHIAMAAGGRGKLVARVAGMMAKERNVTIARAKELLHRLKEREQRMVAGVKTRIRRRRA